MDLGSLLPLLFMNRGNKNSDTADIGDDTASAFMKMMSKGEKPSEADILSTLLKKEGGSPEMAAVLSNALKDRDKQKKKAEGFTPVLGFINDDILGKLTKYFGAKKR